MWQWQFIKFIVAFPSIRLQCIWVERTETTKPGGYVGIETRKSPKIDREKDCCVIVLAMGIEFIYTMWRDSTNNGKISVLFVSEHLVMVAMVGVCVRFVKFWSSMMETSLFLRCYGVDGFWACILGGLSFRLELLRERNESNLVVLSGFLGKMEWKLDGRMVRLKLIYISDDLNVFIGVWRN